MYVEALERCPDARRFLEAMQFDGVSFSISGLADIDANAPDWDLPFAILGHWVSRSPYFHQLSCNACRLADGTWAALLAWLSSCACLTHVQLSRCALGLRQGKGILGAIGRHPVSHLDLGHNHLGPRGTRALVRLLRPSSPPAAVNPESPTTVLASCQTYPAFQSWAKGLPFPPAPVPSTFGASLTVLDLTANGIADVGAARIASVLEHLPQLNVLDLSWNSIGPSGACALARALRQRVVPLDRLNLEGNICGTEGATHVLNAAKPTDECQGVRCVNLTLNYVDDQIFECLNVLYREPHNAPSVDLQWNDLTSSHQATEYADPFCDGVFINVPQAC